MATNAEAQSLDEQAPLASDVLPVQGKISVDGSREMKLSKPVEQEDADDKAEGAPFILPVGQGEAGMSNRVVSKSSDDHADDMLSSLKKLQCDGDFCDVTIICGDFQMKAHCHVLASATEYFKGMFLNETREAKNGIVDFSTMSPEVVKQCMEFIYSGKVDISMLIARDLLDASELMQLPKLSTLCVEFLAENVDMKSCAEIISLSNLYNKGSLDESLEEFLDVNFEEFSESDDFLSMDYQDLMYCLKLLDEYGSDCQEQIWNSILSWTKTDLDQRKSHFPSLFKMLDLKRLAKSSIRNEICKEELVDNSVECLRLVRDVFLTSVEATSSLKCAEEKSSPVVSITKDSGVIVGGSLQNSSVAKFPSKITVDMDVIYHNGKIYVGTGVKIYEYADEKWVSKDVDFTRVRKVAPCVTCPSCYRDHFYLGEGRHFVKRNDIMWSSQPVEGASMVLYSAPTCHGCSTSMQKLKSDESCYNRCIGIGSSIYMLTRNYVIEYDTSSSCVIHHDNSIGLGNGFSVTSFKKSIYALGGNRTECKAVVLNLGWFGNTVTYLPDMPTPKSYVRAFVNGSRLYVTSKTSCNPVELYDFGHKKWGRSKYKMIPVVNNTYFGNDLQTLIQMKHL